MQYPRRVIVKFDDEIGLSIKGRESMRDAIERSGLGDVHSLGAICGNAEPRIVPGIPKVFARTNVDLQKIASRRDLSYRERRLENYVAIELPPGTDPALVLERLCTWRRVELAYEQLELGPAPAYIDQLALHAATMGIGLFNSGGLQLSTTGVTGEGIKFADIEEDWDTTHQDFPDHVRYPTPAVGSATSSSRDHGRRAVGLAAAKTIHGYLSPAPAASTHLVSLWDDWTGGGPSVSLSGAILRAIRDIGLDFGDVLLIESQVAYPGHAGLYLPVEADPMIYDLVRLATALGIIVLEPAGTCSSLGINLDSVDLAVGGHVFDRLNVFGNHEGRESGALIVSGSAGITRSCYQYCNYGARVDLFAPASFPAVRTLEADDTYGTPLLGDAGTSWSAALIAGVALSVQGMIRAQDPTGKYRLGPGPMLNILNSALATPYIGPKKIGVMPNLQGIVQALQVVPDVYVRDSFDDDGSPQDTFAGVSPDIIPHQSEVSPDTFIDPTVDVGQDIQLGIDNFLYCRVYNRATSDPSSPMSSTANAVRVNFYWAYPTTLPTPADWIPIGVALATSLSPATHRVLGPCRWSEASLPVAGSCVLIAVASSLEDPGPGDPPPPLLDLAEYQRLVSENNNVAVRSVTVVEGGAGAFKSLANAATSAQTLPLPLLYVRAFEAEPLVGDLTIRSHLPPGARILVQGPASLIERLLHGRPPFAKFKLTHQRGRRPALVGGQEPKESQEFSGFSEVAEFALPQNASIRFSDVELPAGYRAPIRLIVTTAPKTPPGDYRIVVEQTVGCKTIGAFTFRLDTGGRSHSPTGSQTKPQALPKASKPRRRPAKPIGRKSR